jgi:hypothetical protein
MTMYLGLDVHASATVYVAQDQEGKVLGSGKVSTSREGLKEMLEKVGAPAGSKLALESGSQSFWVSGLLSELGMESYVIEASEVRQKARRPRRVPERDLGATRVTPAAYIPPPPGSTGQTRRSGRGSRWSRAASGGPSGLSNSRNILLRSGWRCCRPIGISGSPRSPRSMHSRAPC